MIAWWWVLVALSVGAFVGLFVAALCNAAGRADEQMEKIKFGGHF